MLLLTKCPLKTRNPQISFRKSKTTFLDIISHLKLTSNITPKYFAESACVIH